MARDRQEVRVVLPKMERREETTIPGTDTGIDLQRRPLDSKTQQFVDDAKALVERYGHAKF